VQSKIPTEYQEACEQVRDHLVCLRGGAPFMSPTDVILLLDWLDDGVQVVDILLALERLAEARQKTRSRAPFTLSKVKRHLGRAMKGGLPAATEHAEQEESAFPLAPLVQFLRQDAEGDVPHPKALLKLATSLEGLEGAESKQLSESAVALIRAFHISNWQALDSAEREGYIRRALVVLSPDGETSDDPVVLNSAEESARATYREFYPVLTTATILDLVKP
jgi:hypothetical protein